MPDHEHTKDIIDGLKMRQISAENFFDPLDCLFDAVEHEPNLLDGGETTEECLHRAVRPFRHEGRALRGPRSTACNRQASVSETEN